MSRREKLHSNTERAAVVPDVEERGQLELLRDVRAAIHQIESGKAVSNRGAKAELRKRFSR